MTLDPVANCTGAAWKAVYNASQAHGLSFLATCLLPRHHQPVRFYLTWNLLDVAPALQFPPSLQGVLYRHKTSILYTD
jgi:hypothetical protein